MENLFVDSDFEPGMHLLDESLNNCIENKVYGFIVKKRGNFSVQFIFAGLKWKAANLKRKPSEELCYEDTKMRKLHNSLENLVLDNQDENAGTSMEKRQTRHNTKRKFDEDQRAIIDGDGVQSKKMK